MAQKTNCGIYQIRNLVNGKKYIGQTRDLTNREEKWPNDLKPNSTRYNQHIKNSFAKYGEDNFDFTTLIDDCQESELDDLEIANILLHDAEDPDYGYNKDEGGKGGRPSEETKNKMKGPRPCMQSENNPKYWLGKERPEHSKTMTEKWKDPEYKLKISHENHPKYWLGKERPDISEIMIEKWKDPVYKLKILEKMSEIIIEKWKEPEYRLKQDESRKKFWEDPEKRLNASKAKKGKNNPAYIHMLDNCKEEILFIYYNTDFSLNEMSKLFECDIGTISARIEKWS
jgi:group I intron endonuclease